MKALKIDINLYFRDLWPQWPTICFWISSAMFYDNHVRLYHSGFGGRWNNAVSSPGSRHRTVNRSLGCNFPDDSGFARVFKVFKSL